MVTTITKKEIEHIALLARLELTEVEKEKHTEQLNITLEYVNKLNQLDTSNVQPTAYVLPLQNVYREDKVTASLSQEEALNNAPLAEDGFFKVPKLV